MIDAGFLYQHWIQAVIFFDVDVEILMTSFGDIKLAMAKDNTY
jgi:hypothetical protein